MFENIEILDGVNKKDNEVEFNKKLEDVKNKKLKLIKITENVYKTSKLMFD